MAGLVFIGKDSRDAGAASPTLSGLGLEFSIASSVADVIAAIEHGEPDLVLASTKIGEESGFELCRHASILRPEVPCILLGDQESFADVTTALRCSAFDFFVRPLQAGLLKAALHRARERQGLTAEVRRMRTALAEATSFEEMIGVSPPMLQLYQLLERAAASTTAVLISGERGTGKALVAKALHRRSKRADGAFVSLDCTAPNEPLRERDLLRALAQAGNGTLFLDEIGQMPIALQSKLVEALVGGDGLAAPTSARIVAATSRNLEVAVAEGGFREDLFYLVQVIHAEVPPLRERASDVAVLAQHYVEHYALVNDKAVAGLTNATLAKLAAYPWPGNVRELQNCIERSVALAGGDQIGLDDLPEKIRRFRRDHVLVVSADPSELVPMDEVERRYILRVLHTVGGNKREAARLLGFDRKTLYRKLARFSTSNRPLDPTLD